MLLFAYVLYFILIIYFGYLHIKGEVGKEFMYTIGALNLLTIIIVTAVHDIVVINCGG